MQGIDMIFYIVILIMSVVIHEVSHGYAAEYFGDKTARYAGRLTLNPIKHLDMFGSIILPLLLIVTNANFLIGWAKPVPYNPDNLTNRKWGTIAIAIAGIAANLLIALVFSLLVRTAVYFDVACGPLYAISRMIIMLNLVLALFNLMPFPPLDGSKILFALLPVRLSRLQEIFEQYAIFIFLVFIFFIWQYVSPIIFLIFEFLVGNSALFCLQ